MKYDIGKILEHYGAEQVHVRHGYTKVRCPFHNDSTPSASINGFKQRFHCFVCDFDGDAIAVIRWQEGGSYADAKRQAEEITGESDSQVPDQSTVGDWLPGTARNHRRDGGSGTAWRVF